MTSTADTGRKGEDAAQDWLRHKGFEICARNWRNGHYEIDIIARKSGVLHIVEVKTRRAESLTSPEYAITSKKFGALQKAASVYIAQHQIYDEVQFDLAAVEICQSGELSVQLVENAMECNW